MIPANMTLEVSELFSRELTRVCINFFPSFTVVFNVIETIMDVDIYLLVKETCDCVIMDICLILISIHL